MFPKLRRAADAKFNAAFLSMALKAQPPQKLAAGLLQFIGLRRALAKDCGGDFLVALPHLPPDEVDALLEYLKGEHVKAQLTERGLKAKFGADAFARSYDALSPDPLAFRIGLSIAVLLICAYERPSTRVRALSVLAHLAKVAHPHLGDALQAAKDHSSLDAPFGGESDTVLQAVCELEPECLHRPLGLMPAWLSKSASKTPAETSSRPLLGPRIAHALKFLALVAVLLGGLGALVLYGLFTLEDSHQRRVAAQYEQARDSYVQDAVECVDGKLTDKAIERLARNSVGAWQQHWKAEQARKKSEGMPHCRLAEDKDYSYLQVSALVRASQNCYYDELPPYFLGGPDEFRLGAGFDPRFANSPTAFFWQDRAVREALDSCPAQPPGDIYLGARGIDARNALATLVVDRFMETSRFKKYAAQVETTNARIESSARRAIENRRLEEAKRKEAEEAAFKAENLKQP